MNFINIQNVMDYIATNETEFKIRRGLRSDCKEVRRLIQELADFEEMPDGPKIDAKGEFGVTLSVLEHDGFVCNPPLFHLFVAEKPEEDSKGDTKELVAYALYFNKYSTWEGKAMILEDLYCTAKYRRKHIGSALFKAVAREAASTGCCRLDFEVLDWNPARKFYEKLGAIDITEKEHWHMYRLPREALEAL